MNKRHKAAYDMRKEGKTFREIGDAFGCGPQRARQMCIHHERYTTKKPEWSDGLSTRTINGLFNAGIKSTEQLQELFSTEENPWIRLKNINNFGKKSFDELCDFVGKPHFKVGELKKYQYCPCCGQKLPQNRELT